MSTPQTPSTADFSSASTPLKKFKLVFLGEQSVGKTSLITRFVSLFNNRPCIWRTVLYDYNCGTQLGKLQLSIALSAVILMRERFRSLIPSYIRDSSVAVIVYDITNRTSFQNTSKWVDDVRNERGQDVIIVLVGNKTDLNDKRQVTPEDLDKRAKELGVMSIETSAKAGHNVKTLFKKIAMALPGGNEAKDSGATSKSVCFGELLMGVEIDVSASPQEVPQASGCSC
ncbi:hypothetical protein I312_105912 [Cryptococcus bacillisporus CA1280]|uniref:uncharacterized protein n=1 Tax=Cryptococcus bacillisporus CA1280 TaxID=1296109 RepID=UPI003366DF8B